jgi:hypothetical protein
VNIAIFGSRTYSENDYAYFCSQIRKHFKDESFSFIIGNGAGIDRLAEWYSRDFEIEKKIITPDYQTYGKRAFLVRKFNIIKQADVVFAMWDGWSKETNDSVVIAQRLGKRVVKEIYEGDGYDYLIDSSYS